jgi:hypothetical protein
LPWVLRQHDPVLGKQAADLVDQLRPARDEAAADPMQTLRSCSSTSF